MAEFVEDCPRCGIKAVTFIILGDYSSAPSNWDAQIEAFCLCRNCFKGSIGFFTLQRTGSVTSEVANTGKLSGYQGKIPYWYHFETFLTAAVNITIPEPEHLPAPVSNCFREGAAAFAVGAWNAAAAMFRLTLDIATKDRLPPQPAEEGGPNAKQRKNLYDRLNYLFDTSILPADLRDLADCIREDGNDGAHDGTLTKADAEDLIDFAEALLERVYTEPARLELAKARRIERRGGSQPQPGR